MTTVCFSHHTRNTQVSAFSPPMPPPCMLPQPAPLSFPVEKTSVIMSNIHFFKSNSVDKTSVFGNTINILIPTSLWSFAWRQENRKSSWSDCLYSSHDMSQICFPSPVCSHLLCLLIMSPRLIFQRKPTLWVRAQKLWMWVPPSPQTSSVRRRMRQALICASAPAKNLAPCSRSSKAFVLSSVTLLTACRKWWVAEVTNSSSWFSLL